MAYAPSAGTQVVCRALVLGTLALDRDGLRLDASRWQHRVQTLFALLATAPDRHMQRDELIEILWPEVEPDVGAGNLRTLVHRLRLALGGDPPSVLSEGGWTALNPAYGWELDLDCMEAAIAEAEGDLDRLEVALAMYRGEPLPDHRYEDWAVPLRDRAERVWRDGVRRLAAGYHSRRRYADAVRQYERVLGADPFDEAALRGLLLALVHDGRRLVALRRYERFREALDADMGVPPSEETELLAEHIRSQEEAPAGGPDPSMPTGGFLGARPDGPLIGRQRELELLQLAMDAAVAGAGRLVMLSGELGVGRTRLAQEAMLALGERGYLIAAACCSERDRALLFGPFLDLLAQLYAAAPRNIQLDAELQWPQLVWLLPEGTIALKESLLEEQDEQRALVRALAGFVRALAQERPVALLLDDLQWADEGSLALLHALARETRGESVFLLATYRDGEVSPDHPLIESVRIMSREGLIERVPLHALGSDETATLIGHLLGDSPDELTEFVYRRTKGNPFHIVRMLRALGGRYRLIRQIGSGGMGRVFEAEDAQTGERMAVKLTFARTEADPRAVLRFRQEGAILSELHDPRIVQVRSTVVEEHASFIAMELLEGRSLAEVMREEPLPLERVKTIAGQIAQALTAAHERGIVHRDIKPSNVMVLEADRVKVADFGVARLLRPHAGSTSMTSTGMMMGTPSYMAPEQIEDRRVDGRADIYALGATLYHLVTGRPPFDSDDPFTVAFRQIHEPPVPPSALRPQLPQDWDHLILRALAKNPVDRFPSAVAMGQAIESLTTQDLPVSVGREPEKVLPPAFIPLRPPESRAGVGPGRRAWWWPVAALAAVPILLAALALFLANRNGGPGGPGPMNGVTTVAVGTRGDVYAVDAGDGRFLEFSPDGAFVRQWGSPRPGLLQFGIPSDIAVGPHDIYVSDHTNNWITHLHGGKPEPHFQIPGGALALDSHGDLYASDYYSHLIWHLTGQSGDVIDALHVPMLWAGRADYPAGLTVGPDGLLYVADRQNDRIVVLRPRRVGGATSLTVVHIWGRRDPTGRHGWRKKGQFSAPSDVAVDARGIIYVADTGNNRIQKLRWDGRRLHVLWVRGEAGTGLGQFSSPSSVAVDRQGNVYVADMYNSRLQKFSPKGAPLWATDGEHLQRAGA